MNYCDFQAVKNSMIMQKELFDNCKVNYTFNQLSCRSVSELILYGQRGEANFAKAKEILSKHAYLKVYFLTLTTRIYSHTKFLDSFARERLSKMRERVFRDKMKLMNPDDKTTGENNDQKVMMKTIATVYEICGVNKSNVKG